MSARHRMCRLSVVTVPGIQTWGRLAGEVQGMRKGIIGVALFLVGVALPAAETAVLPACRSMGPQDAGRGRDGRREAERGSGVHEGS